MKPKRLSAAKTVPRRRRVPDDAQSCCVPAEPLPMMEEMRRRAEALLRRRQKTKGAGQARPTSPVDASPLLHELQVHQVELEMQNAELTEARDRMEALLEKFTDLYDFAPLGYYSLDERGRILEANLTGAALLGAERTRLLGQPMARFVAPENQPRFQAFLKQVLAGAGKHQCEAEVRKQSGAFFWAEFCGIVAISLSGSGKWCRVAVSDITERKHAEAAQRETAALTVTNQDLRREIARREAVEQALRESEQHQARMLAQSRHMQGQLRDLSHRLLQAQEEERRRISRELHDEVAQTLVGINVHLETLNREVKINPGRLRQKIARTQRVVEQAVNLVHRFARELRPAALDDLGLIATLHALLKEFMKRTGIRVQFIAFAGVERLNSARRAVVYRVVQSALTNVARHAQASRVKVTIARLRHMACVEIADDGKGFQVERMLSAREPKRLGLLGMRERVEMVGGVFSVASTPGQGATIRAHIPFGNRPARGGVPAATVR